MSVFEVCGGNDRRSMIKRYERKSKRDAIAELVDLIHCNWRQVEQLEAAQQQAEQVPAELEGVAEQLAEGSGFWRSCSGCHETEDGHPLGSYVTSAVLQCELGSGCSECGGLGATWDNIDYSEMAEYLEEDDAPPAAPAAPDQAEREVPRPTGLSQGWNLTLQCDGFVIGHQSTEPTQKHKDQALADGRVFIPFLVAQDDPTQVLAGLVAALEDFLSMYAAKVSCQAGVVIQCRCQRCIESRAWSALAAHRAQQPAAVDGREGRVTVYDAKPWGSDRAFPMVMESDFRKELDRLQFVLLASMSIVRARCEQTEYGDASARTTLSIIDHALTRIAALAGGAK